MKKYIILLIAIISLISIKPVFAAEKSCKIIDGAYYDSNGQEVDKVAYEKACKSHSCEIVGDTFYGKSGSEVTREKFENECDAKVVYSPDTSSNVEIIFVVIGAICIITSSVLIIKRAN